MRPSWIAFVAFVLLAAQAPLWAGPAEDCVDAQLRVVKGLDEQIATLARIADEAAQRLLAGGKLCLAGERGMVLELHVRAGGLCTTHVFQPGKTQLGANDVVLFSDYGGVIASVHLFKPETLKLWAELGKSPALVIAFASEAHPFLKRLPANGFAVPLKMPYDSRVVQAPSGEKLVPAATPAVAIAQWAFVAELIGACRRQGKQLAVYLSIHLDEGRKRFERTKGLVFEPDLKPEPAPAGQSAKEFLGHVRGALEAVRRDETARIRAAAEWLRTAKADGKKVVRHLYGHMPPTEAGLLGDPAQLFTDTVTGPVGDKGVEWIRKNLAAGDVYLLVGYQQNEDAMAEAANALGTRTIFLTSLAPGVEQAKNPLHLYVNPHWPLTDGCLDLPGYDVKACPLSGILGLTVYYAICAEAIAPK